MPAKFENTDLVSVFLNLFEKDENPKGFALNHFALQNV